MKRYLHIGIYILVAFMLVSCNKTPSTSELIEKYSESENVTIWLYDHSDTIENAVSYFNYRYEQGKVILEKYSSTDMDLSQFQQKLQASVMSADGPDLILSNNPLFVKDVEKMISSGTLGSWDDLVSEWEDEIYYHSAIQGAKSKDGELYILPLSFDISMIYTTNAVQESYQLVEDHFKNFDSLTDTLLKVEQQPLFYGSIDFLSCIPTLYDVENRSTDLLVTQNQTRWDDWNQLLQKKEMKSGLTTQQQLNLVADETIPFLIADSSLMETDLVYYPIRDVHGNLVGRINWYALLPKSSNKTKTINAFMQSFVFDTGSLDYGNGISLSVERSKLQGYGEISELLNQKMQLYPRTSNRMIFQSKLEDCILQSDEDDWQELERSINIYLSE